jgi:hypothetical protein
MPKWIRGHASVFRIAVSSVAAVFGVMLAVLPLAAIVKISAPVTACVVLFVMYLWAEFGHSESSAQQAHVKDLQNFAGWAEQVVGLTHGFDFSTPKAKSFRVHFPKVGKEIDAWNGLMQQLPRIDTRFVEFTNIEEPKRLGLDASTALPSMLNLVVRGFLSLSDLTWQVQGGWVQAYNQGTFAVVPLPPDEVSTCKLISNVWNSLTTVNEKPVVREYNAIHQKVEALRATLNDGLRTVEAKHRPEGRCDLCPT